MVNEGRQKKPSNDIGCRANFDINGKFFFLSHFCCNQIMSYLCQKCKKTGGVTDFVFEIKRVENYPNFDKPALKNDFLN